VATLQRRWLLQCLFIHYDGEAMIQRAKPHFTQPCSSCHRLHWCVPVILCTPAINHTSVLCTHHVGRLCVACVRVAEVVPFHTDGARLRPSTIRNPNSARLLVPTNYDQHRAHDQDLLRRLLATGFTHFDHLTDPTGADQSRGG